MQMRKWGNCWRPTYQSQIMKLVTKKPLSPFWSIELANQRWKHNFSVFNVYFFHYFILTAKLFLLKKIITIERKESVMPHLQCTPGTYTGCPTGTFCSNAPVQGPGRSGVTCGAPLPGMTRQKGNTQTQLIHCQIFSHCEKCIEWFSRHSYPAHPKCSLISMPGRDPCRQLDALVGKPGPGLEVHPCEECWGQGPQKFA